MPSKQLYTLPSETEYDFAKNAYLSSMDNHRYQQKSTEDKWTFVVREMAALLQGDDIFKEGSTKPPVHYVTDFKEKRKKRKVGITVAQCTSYFEDFLFLLKTSDARFSISPPAKASLMQSITTAIDKCETGIHTMFYAILQEHQKSTDWIKSELSKARCESIHMLQKNYSKRNGLLSDFSDVHTYNELVDLANKEELGIKKKDDIRDWMLHYLFDTEEMSIYFAANYRATFEKYESEVEQTLTLHVISEISSTLTETSADESSVISSENSQRMDQLLSTHFSVDILPEAYLRCFFEEHGSGDYIKLVPQSQYKPFIQKWIKQTLIREGY